MRYSKILDAKKRVSVVERLANDFDYHDVQGKSYADLKRILVGFQATKIDVECASNKFFRDGGNKVNSNTELHQLDLEIARLKQENDYYKSSEKYRNNIVKALTFMSLAALIAGFMIGVSI